MLSKHVTICITAVLAVAGWLMSAVPATPAAPITSAAVPHLGYGFNVAGWDISLMQSMGFDWIKVFGGPGNRLPLNVLIRVDAQASHLNNIATFTADIAQLAAEQADYIEAYEIGNEPNLDASYGWGGVAPNAADYVTLLCAAYDAIHANDATAVVVSAGLAPTGRVTGNWNGHAGHNGFYQDEREFLREMIVAGAGDCLDAVGYHPYGFSADYDTPPDTSDGTPAGNCTNGFCFRGTEKIYEIMQQEGWGDRQVWATEFGWITHPPNHCLNDPGWQGRAWQIVDEQSQADNLAGAFQYADVHWPWMGAMTVFNLNFNMAPYYPECEQMRFYAVQGRPAEGALRDMPKNPAGLPARLHVSPAAWNAAVDTTAPPMTATFTIDIANAGWTATTITTTVDATLNLQPILADPIQSLGAGGSTAVTVTLPFIKRPPGVYDGLITLTADPATQGAPHSIPLQLTVFTATDYAFQPLIIRQP